MKTYMLFGLLFLGRTGGSFEGIPIQITHLCVIADGKRCKASCRKFNDIKKVDNELLWREGRFCRKLALEMIAISPRANFLY